MHGYTSSSSGAVDADPMQRSTAELRKTLRATRRSLSRAEQLSNSKAAAKHLIRSGLFLRSKTVAIYLAQDGEIDPAPLARSGFEYGKKIYLPVLRQDGKKALWFAEFRPGEQMSKNRFGIDEPAAVRDRTSPSELDLILLPLVGFDRNGNRIGMGGGYYDRTLAYMKNRKHWHRPKLIGMAHECQRLSSIQFRSWDIPLDGVVSESGLFLFVKKTI